MRFSTIIASDDGELHHTPTAAIAMPLRKKLNAHTPDLAEECFVMLESVVCCVSLSVAAFGRSSESGSRSGCDNRGRRSGAVLMLSGKFHEDATRLLKSERWR